VGARNDKLVMLVRRSREHIGTLSKSNPYLEAHMKTAVEEHSQLDAMLYGLITCPDPNALTFMARAIMYIHGKATLDHCAYITGSPYQTRALIAKDERMKATLRWTSYLLTKLTKRAMETADE